MNKKLCPMSLKPIYKQKIWGGDWLKRKYGRVLPSDDTGESWDVSCHPNGVNEIINGELKGMKLDDACKELGEKLLGSRIKGEFPILIKMLDADKVLSVQVHPADAYAAIHADGDTGKTEMWYVVDALPDAYLIYGLKQDIDKQTFIDAVKNQNIESCLNKLYVKAGDVVYMPAGMVHAIGEGVLICEIQQNSDTTYRVYDWNRMGDDGRPRELHIERAIDVIDFDGSFPNHKLQGLNLVCIGGSRTIYAACPYFAMEKLTVIDDMPMETNGSTFHALSVIDGDGVVSSNCCETSFKSGDSLLIPADSGSYTIRMDSKGIILRTWFPDIDEDIVKPLTEKGYSKNDISKIAGI